jgi:hypothetical protein
MPDIGDIPDITDLISEKQKITVKKVKGNGWPCMPQVSRAVNCRPADVKPCFSPDLRFKNLFLPAE